MTWRVFSIGQCRLLKTKPLCWRQIMHVRLLFKKNQMWLNCWSVLYKGWSKGLCIIEKDFHGPRIFFNLIYSKELPSDVGSVLPPMLSEWIAVKHMFHWFHWLRTAIWATFVNLNWDFTAPLVNCDCLMDDRPEEKCLLFYLSFVPDDIPLGECGGGIWLHHLCIISILRVACLVIHFLLPLAK